MTSPAGEEGQRAEPDDEILVWNGVVARTERSGSPAALADAAAGLVLEDELVALSERAKRPA